jgi:spermidine/putrescine transport system permease protein
MKSKNRALFLIGPPAIFLITLFIIPMAMMFLYSFRSGTFGNAEQGWTFENYQTFFNQPGYLGLLWRSVLIALVTALISILLAYPVAYFLAFKAGKKRFNMLTILLVPAWTSYLLRILAWKLIFSSGGLLNAILLGLGWIDEAQPILLYTKSAVVVTLIYSWIPFVTLPIFSSLDRIDGRLLEAAADLGSPPWKSFLRVTLPLSFPGVIAGFFIVFIPTLGEWVTPHLVGGVTGLMYGNAIQDQFVRALNWPLGSVMSFILLALVLVLLLIFSRVGKITDMAGV